MYKQDAITNPAGICAESVFVVKVDKEASHYWEELKEETSKNMQTRIGMEILNVRYNTLAIWV